MRRNKYDIKVYTRYYMRLVILFSILFIGVLWGSISLYCIEKKPVNVSIIVSIFFMIFFGGIALFQYIAFAPKLYVYGNKIVIKKWYGLRRKYYVQDIDKVIFEKSEGKIVTIQIISSISKDKYIDTVENFDKLLNYLLKKVEKEKMECYILGTKEEAEIWLNIVWNIEKSEDKDILELRIRHIKTFICRDLQKIFLSIWQIDYLVQYGIKYKN